MWYLTDMSVFGCFVPFTDVIFFRSFSILIVNQPSDSETTSAITAKYPIVKLIDFGFSNQWDEVISLAIRFI